MDSSRIIRVILLCDYRGNNEVDYCIDNNLKLPEYYCHSMNPVGKNNILSVLNQFKQRTSV